MNKRIFEKVLREKGKIIAFNCIKYPICVYIGTLVLGMVEIKLTGETIINAVDTMVAVSVVGTATFVLAFLGEVYCEKQK